MTIEQYLSAVSQHQGRLIADVRDVILSVAPDADEALKWGVLVYSKDGPICFVRAVPYFVEVGFWRASALDDPSGQLRLPGGEIARIKLGGIEDLNRAALADLITQAVALNQTLGDPR
ncbi:MAG TPA: DUF1801 domain-containing protein, partial [Acidimicrobiales bacterium]|nr:DUF1801 domain-containing protein [Acidimicrobiales bacterium]